MTTRPLHRNDAGALYHDGPIRAVEGHAPFDTPAQCPVCSSSAPPEPLTCLWCGSGRMVASLSGEWAYCRDCRREMELYLNINNYDLSDVTTVMEEVDTSAGRLSS